MRRIDLFCATVAMLGMLSFAQAEPGGRESAACAAWDLHIVSLIEQVGMAEPMAVRLVEAAQRVQQARAACRDGHTARAMRLYEDIDLQPPSRAAQPVFGLF